MTKDKFIHCVLQYLKLAGLKPYIHTKALTGSVYIKFESNIKGSLRVGSHKQRAVYHYRWNLREDYTEIKTKYHGHLCYYYPFKDVDLMIRDMLNELKIKDLMYKSF